MEQLKLAATTPRRISGRIRRFLSTLGVTGRPVFLPYTHLSHDYRPGYCLPNCEAQNRRSGDAIAFGWVIWEDRACGFIEAEFHAVIKRRGELLDITPRRDGEQMVLYVADRNRTAERIDNRTWRTWENHKSLHGKVFHPTASIEIRDLVDNVLA
jgi:hypothetical protein